MLTNNILLKSFFKKKGEKKIQKKLYQIINERSELLKSMSKSYIDNYNSKKIKKIASKKQ